MHRLSPPQILFIVVTAALSACAKETPPRLEIVTAPAATDVAPLIATEVAAAARDHRTLLVYIGAPWCEPCRYFHAAAVAGELDGAFGQLRLLEFDADRDTAALERAGYRSAMIPLFAVPLPDGTASGRQIAGSIKGAGAVAQITPRLRALLAE